MEITKWDDLCDLFYLLLIGAGVGFSCTKENASKLSALHLPEEIVHKPYEYCGNSGNEGSITMEQGNYTIYIGDSKEGWVNAFRDFIWALSVAKFATIPTGEIAIKKITLVYDNVRPKGERLKVFGGTASGHEPLKTMFQSIEKMLKGELDATTPAPIDGQVRPVHVLDIGNLIGNNVVCGGVRRTAEIFLCDADDWECILAKFGINGIWGEESQRLVVEIGEKLERLGIVLPQTIPALIADPQAKMHLHHRRMSNNSIAFREKPTQEMLEVLFDIMKLEGEPGFVNLEAAGKRRPNAKGLNPCVEIILDSYGVCNLTTLNLAAQWDSEEDLLAAQALSARAGLRMTLADMEMQNWDIVQKRDRLLGVSLTGVQDSGATMELLEKLRVTANEEATAYAKELEVNRP